MDVTPYIRRVAEEAQSLLDAAYALEAGLAGDRLEQAGLRNGLAIVEDYLTHGEAGVALEHLLYMIIEPALVLSERSQADIRHAAKALGMTGALPAWLGDDGA
jgi:hypothetical protein